MTLDKSVSDVLVLLGPLTHDVQIDECIVVGSVLVVILDAGLFSDKNLALAVNDIVEQISVFVDEIWINQR